LALRTLVVHATQEEEEEEEEEALPSVQSAKKLHRTVLKAKYTCL